MVATPRRKDRTRKNAPPVSEADLHRSVAELLDWVLLSPAMYTTIPGGWGALPRATAGILKACGYRKGFPDILILWKSKALCIELKTATGKQSRDQVVMEEILFEAGVAVIVCRSLEDVYITLKSRGYPLREMTFATKPMAHQNAVQSKSQKLAQGSAEAQK